MAFLVSGRWLLRNNYRSEREGHPMTSFQSAGAASSQDPDEEPDYLADCDLSDLLGTFREIEDPRGRNGGQHELPFVLGVCVVAILAGAKGYAEIARRARGMTQRLLAALGADWEWFRSRRTHPSEGTIRRQLSGIDACPFTGCRDLVFS
jgi:hypothetical protein